MTACSPCRSFAGDVLSLLGRLALSAIFVSSALNKIGDFDGLVANLSAQGFPIPTLFALGAIALLVVGSLLVISGLRACIGAALLLVFLAPTTLIFHPPATDATQFMKNLGLAGGLLILMAHGSGRISLDSLLAKRKPAPPA